MTRIAIVLLLLTISGCSTNQYNNYSKDASSLQKSIAVRAEEVGLQIALQEFSLDLATWIISKEDFPEFRYRDPEIIILSYTEMENNTHCQLLKVPAGCYYFDDEKLYLRADTILQQKRLDIGVVVHEIVHHLLHISERMDDFACVAKTEPTAYKIQRIWYEEIGHPKDFEKYYDPYWLNDPLCI